MPFCSWCISDERTQSDDGTEDSKAPAKTRTSKKSKEAVAGKSPDELFDAYAQSDDPQTMGAEGLEKLCAEANIQMDGAQPILLAWQLDAKELGTFTRDEWTKNLGELDIKSLDSLVTAILDLEDLLVHRKPPPPKPTTQSISKGIKTKSAPPVLDTYKKDRYWSYTANVADAFSKFYYFCFALVRREGSRNIDMEYACAFWSVILAPSCPLMTEIVEFINEKGTYKGVNKDLWSMMKDFCETVQPSLEGYNSEEAWPTLLDDFVEWKKAKRDPSTGGAPS